jgi:ABC-2 type transport system permease protein
MSLAWMFFRRDAAIEMSYRISFIVQLVANLLVLGVCYFMGRMISRQPIPELEQYGGSYLGFMLIGVALTDCVGVSLSAFAKQVRDGQMTGTLELTLLSPIRLPLILIFSSLWTYAFCAVRFLTLLVVGIVLYGVSVKGANIGAAILVFFLTVVSFAGIGILWASVVLLIKRGEAVMHMAEWGAIILSGVFFPIAMLPGWVQPLSLLIPLTHSLEAMRLSLLKGASFSALSPQLLTLTLFALVLMSVGLFCFGQAVQYARRTGSLTEY